MFWYRLGAASSQGPPRVRDPRVLAPASEPGCVFAVHSLDPYTPLLVEHGRHCPRLYSNRQCSTTTTTTTLESQPSSCTRASPTSSYRSISPPSNNTSILLITCTSHKNHRAKRRDSENMTSDEDQLPPKQRLPRTFRECVGNDTKVSMADPLCGWRGQSI